jgi:multidrug efflux pump subunit AcrA (membrane-fusion protein)
MTRYLSPSIRRLVLGGALLAATLCAILPDPPPVRAAEFVPYRVQVAQADAKAAPESARDAAKDASRAAKDAAREARAAAREARRNAEAEDDADAADADSPHRHHRGVTIGLGGIDRQYDSFDQFLDHDPALAALVLGIVFIVFLTPLLIIGLIIWYKVRKNRMQNEMMLKLAEKGIVAPADAMQAIGTGRVGPLVSAAAASAPLAEQARVLRKSAAWSDLRKGVLMGTVGFALTVYATFEDGSPSWIGLVLLFLGIGYVVLWYFEDRQAAALPPAPLPGPGDPAN